MRGRPKIYENSTLVCVNSEKASIKLQPNSERRAIVNRIIDNGGTMTIGAVCEAFGFDVTNNVKALVRRGWLRIIGSES